MFSIHNVKLFEEMYEKYKTHPASCDLSWRLFFEGMEWGEKIASAQPSKGIRISHLISAYRTFGHLMARINPLEPKKPTVPHQLSLETLGFKKEEMSQEFPTLGLLSEGQAPLTKIIDKLQEIYGGLIGIEYMHLTLPEMKKWLQHEIETTNFRPSFSLEKKKGIFNWLSKSTLFETFLHTRYVGQKRFSLEGGETLIPILQELVEIGAQNGMDEVVIGMAHRGRLNVLTNILGKSMGHVFGEFEDFFDPTLDEGSGDVKYHKGFSANITTGGKQVHISLTPNPSHLESVCPVVVGKVRAKQVARNDVTKEKIIPILIHGDASLSGQGVVYETAQFFNLEGYSTGGTIHVIINNQIGFTTRPKDSRSTPYCTGIANSFTAPIFHVNAEDPEGCVYAAKLAILLRQKYHIDVYIDMNCYRKYGHNEGDEPAFTQPLENDIIRKKKSIREIYLEKLKGENVIEEKEAKELEESFKADLHHELEETKKKREYIKDEAFQGVWKDFRNGDLQGVVDTTVAGEKLKEVVHLFSKVPSDFSLHPKVAKLITDRIKQVEQGAEIDFACAEHLAFATLLLDQVPVRLTGQDSRRGTFSQRHAMWVDQVNGKTHIPLAHMATHQGRFDTFDSPLSEFGALGFEFGYSLAYPSALVIWEAQYGDFANGAQVIMDQYLSASEQKWNRYSGLVLLLPHGFEGQGPEHSSARLERFLQLAGDQNLQIVNPTTPAQYFHLLRRQVLSKRRKPLVMMAPKGLLRHQRCKSSLEEFSKGSFEAFIEDTLPKERSRRLLLCSGRIYYDLIEEREKKKIEDIALVRIEQLYPIDEKKLEEILRSYPNLKEIYWVQEEPENMGAWLMLLPLFHRVIPENVKLEHVARKGSGSVACGSHALHVKEQQELMRKAYE